MGSNMTTSQPASAQRHLGARRGRGDSPMPYDFRRPTKLSREYVRRLQIVFETFARRYATLLTSTLRVVSQVSLVSIEQLTYDEYIASLANPTVMAQVTLEPLPGTAILEFSLAAAMASIDHMLGGPGGSQPQRPPTDLETPLLRRLLDRVLGELQYAFEPLVATDPHGGPIEYNPQFVQVCAASDAVVVSSYEMKIGAEECVATFCLPLASIQSKLQVDTDVTYTDAQRLTRENAYRNVVAGLQNTPIDVSVRFAGRQMTPAELIAMRPGDVVRLGHPVNQPLDVIAAGITFAHAVPGNKGTQLACLIVPSTAKEKT
jgi:flagellar motor switch protein FliM